MICQGVKDHEVSVVARLGGEQGPREEPRELESCDHGEARLTGDGSGCENE